MKRKIVLFLLFVGCMAVHSFGQKHVPVKKKSLRLALKMEKPGYDSVMTKINEYNTRIVKVLTDPSKSQEQKNLELSLLREQRKKFMAEHLTGEQQKALNNYTASTKTRSPYKKREIKGQKQITEEQFKGTGKWKQYKRSK